MSNEPNADSTNGPADDTSAAERVDDEVTDGQPALTDDSATEMLTVEPPAPPLERPTERRFTAPSGFDSGSTEMIDVPPEPATEILSVGEAPAGMAAATAPTAPTPTPKIATPQAIPPRGNVRLPGRSRSWGWVLALILVIAALAAVAILCTVLLTRDNSPKVSQEDRVRSTIQNFDTAVQNGDLATLRSITCGATRDKYVNYDDRQWADIHQRVAAAKQYPVVASVDEVVVNGDHAEANVTSFMAFDPATRSTRSFDLQFRDEQWKICQAPGN
jgi:hypothetical protein